MPRYSNFSKSPWGIIPQRVDLPGVSYTSQSQFSHGFLLRRVYLLGDSYCAESISLGYHTAQSQSLRGIILHRVNLPGVWDPGSQQLFLKTFAQAFKGILSHKLMLIFITLIKSYILHLCQKILG